VVLAGAKRGRVAAIDVDWVFRRELRIHGVAARQSWAVDAALDLLLRDGDILAALDGPAFPLAGVTAAIEALVEPSPPVHTVVVPGIDSP
jgi:hypothetical protein